MNIFQPVQNECFGGVGSKVSLSRRQGGFFVSYILSGLALLMLLVAAASSLFSSGNLAQEVEYRREALSAQFAQITNTLLLCGIQYPVGNNGSGFHVVYPAVPVSGLARDLTCPGDVSSAATIWLSGHLGQQLPGIPVGIQDWRYTNTAANISISATVATAGDPTARSILKRAALRAGGDASISVDLDTLTIILIR